MRPAVVTLATLLLAGTAHASQPEAEPSPEGAAAAEAATTPENKPKPVLRKMVKPQWPNEAKRAGIEQDTCKVLVSVNEKGRPTDTEVDDCYWIFHDAASRTIMRWRWEPLVRDGEPISYKTQYTLTITSRPR